MEHEIYAAIKGWAGIPTWHTCHALDEARFREAIATLYWDIGADVSADDFRKALRRHRDENPVLLGGTPSDEQVEAHVDRAMTALAGLKRRSLQA